MENSLDEVEYSKRGAEMFQTETGKAPAAETAALRMASASHPAGGLCLNPRTGLRDPFTRIRARVRMGSAPRAGNHTLGGIR